MGWGGKYSRHLHEIQEILVDVSRNPSLTRLVPSKHWFPSSLSPFHIFCLAHCLSGYLQFTGPCGNSKETMCVCGCLEPLYKGFVCNCFSFGYTRWIPISLAIYEP